MLFLLGPEFEFEDSSCVEGVKSGQIISNDVPNLLRCDESHGERLFGREEVFGAKGGKISATYLG